MLIFRGVSCVGYIHVSFTHIVLELLFIAHISVFLGHGLKTVKNVVGFIFQALEHPQHARFGWKLVIFSIP